MKILALLLVVALASLAPLSAQVSVEVVLDQESSYYLGQGQSVWQLTLQLHQRYKIYNEKHEFIGVGEVDDAGRLAPKRLLVLHQQ